jgi:uncharacterized protein
VVHRLALVVLLWVLCQGLPGAAFPRRAYLENFLRTLERDTSAEVVVVTVASLDGLSIEDYAVRLFAEWGVGDQAKDNGVLLLVAPLERRVRIEVGYGLEGSLPDGLAGDIIRTAILPEFQQGNLRRGIGRGLDRISRIVRGEASAVRAPLGDEGGVELPSWMIAPFFGIFVGLGGMAAGLGLRTRTLGLLVAGGLFTVIPLVIAAAISPISLALLLPLELAAMAFGYRKGSAPDWIRGIRGQASPGTNDDDWVMGGTTGGSSASDSVSDSSSSDFGGGSSGGGGASGRW